MLITIKNGVDRSLVAKSIDHRFNLGDSRFTVEVEEVGKTRIKIRNVRLRESKRYCGNHPYACDIETGRKGKYLEGSDWVEFNDLLNDVLDGLHVGAWVRSSVCEIRRGTERRISYDGYLANSFNNEFQWYKQGEDWEYEDHCGSVAPNSEFPLGTPGIYSRSV